VVHGGVPLDRFRPAPPDADPGPAFGMVGALSRRKGIDVFAEAARLVRAEVPEARFELVGGFTEPLDAEWAGSVLARANGAVEHVEGADVAAVLPGWAALAVPSRADPFPNVVLEGMAAGLPVVGSRVDGIVEQVTPETGVLVRADDPRALAEALLALHRDPERRRAMGAAARARAESEFSLERQAAGLESAYLRAIGARRR
jgi:glycosyltransferase involved in cell wall biosynthesis